MNFVVLLVAPCRGAKLSRHRNLDDDRSILIFTIVTGGLWLILAVLLDEERKLLQRGSADRSSGLAFRPFARATEAPSSSDLNEMQGGTRGKMKPFRLGAGHTPPNLATARRPSSGKSGRRSGKNNRQNFLQSKV
ncbi:unnamed protein product, partial [Mesorhabditis belari]|uniref:Uncharacterized protein n=1 Tax=Mesorhabditis belari TaxID=2138241 RepID=A0AAF3F0J7_9BILA